MADYVKFDAGLHGKIQNSELTSMYSMSSTDIFITQGLPMPVTTIIRQMLQETLEFHSDINFKK
jgi:hypothetical protein